ncbi:MAG TPA: antibiotic biosynthesis monooxygenase family protein [Holophagaceae bacterium]|nr:antibiotic biosynthesis monooxygenase family protein [Holophagaceae bacterium]
MPIPRDEPHILGTTLKVRSGKREEVRQTLTVLGDHFKGQEGCLAYLILEEPARNPELTFLTVWRDGGAAASHLASEACRILLGATRILCEPAPFALQRMDPYPGALPPGVPSGSEESLQ